VIRSSSSYLACLITLPLGAMILLPPQNCKPSSMPARLAKARKTVFSIALAVVRTSKNPRRMEGEADMHAMSWAPWSLSRRVISGK